MDTNLDGPICPILQFDRRGEEAKITHDLGPAGIINLANWFAELIPPAGLRTGFRFCLFSLLRRLLAAEYFFH